MLDSSFSEPRLKEEKLHSAFSEGLGLLDPKILFGIDASLPEKSCCNTQEDKMSTTTTASQNVNSASECPSSFCFSPKDVITYPFLNTGPVPQNVTLLPSPFSLSSSPNLSLPMGPVATSRLAETSHNEHISTTSMHSPTNGVYLTHVIPVSNFEENRAGSVNDGMIRIAQNGADRSFAQLKENISRAPKEVLAIVLNSLVETNSDNLNYHIMELFTAANNLFVPTVPSPLLSVSQFSAFENVHPTFHPQSFADPSCTTPSEVSMSNIKVPFVGGSHHSNGSPTKRSVGGGSRHNKNYNKEDDQRRCAIHGELRPIRCLKLLAEKGQFECIPGYHCLVEKKL